MPITVISALRRGDFDEAVAGLFGDGTDDAMGAGLSMKDLDRIAHDIYGMSNGESEASPT